MTSRLLTKVLPDIVIDDSLAGKGTPDDPLRVAGGGQELVVNDTLEGDGTLLSPLGTRPNKTSVSVISDSILGDGTDASPLTTAPIVQMPDYIYALQSVSEVTWTTYPDFANGPVFFADLGVANGPPIPTADVSLVVQVWGMFTFVRPAVLEDFGIQLQIVITGDDDDIFVTEGWFRQTSAVTNGQVTVTTQAILTQADVVQVGANPRIEIDFAAQNATWTSFGIDDLIDAQQVTMCVRPFQTAFTHVVAAPVTP